MKYLVFVLALSVGVPLAVMLGARSRIARLALFAIAFLGISLGGSTSINFSSMETYRGVDRGYWVGGCDLTILSLFLSTWLAHGRRLNWLPFNSIFMTLFGVWAGLSCARSELPQLGTFALCKFAWGYLTYLTVCNHVSLDRPSEVLRWCFSATSFWIVVQVLVQKYVQGQYRVTGPMDSPTALPTFILLFFPSYLLWTFQSRRQGRQVAVELILQMGLLGAIVATYSRLGLLLGVAVFFACVVIAFLRAERARFTQLALIAGLLLILMGCKAAARVAERFSSAPQASGQTRVYFNVAAQTMCADNPLWGVGPNLFSYTLSTSRSYYNIEEDNEGGGVEATGLAVTASEHQAGNCHHLFWQLAAESGWVGLFLSSTVMGRFWLRFFRYGLSNQSLRGSVVLGLALALTGTYLMGMFESVLLQPLPFRLYFLLAGVGVAFSAEQRAKVAKD